MAYLKYKELTKYFNFYKSLDIKNLPEYVYDYIAENEKIRHVYSTLRDRGVFTDKKLIIFDKEGIGSTKQISVVPYKSLSAMSIKYLKSNVILYFYLDSGYPVTIKFRKMSPDDKKEIRKIYTMISEVVVNRRS